MTDIRTPAELMKSFSEEKLFHEFNSEGLFSKHVLTIYSIAVGMNAKNIVELGIGTSTRVLRAAAIKNNGVLHSCDSDSARYGYLKDYQDNSWKLNLCASEIFLNSIDEPVDFVLHDAAHDYFQVKLDLEMLMPKMRQFGIICIHDTQQPDLAHDMLSALKDGLRDFDISMTSLPYASGLTIIRLENGGKPPREVGQTFLPDGRPATELISFPMRFSDASFEKVDRSSKRKLRWKLRKLVKGY